MHAFDRRIDIDDDAFFDPHARGPADTQDLQTRNSVTGLRDLADDGRDLRGAKIQTDDELIGFHA